MAHFVVADEPVVVQQRLEELRRQNSPSVRNHSVACSVALFQ